MSPLSAAVLLLASLAAAKEPDPAALQRARDAARVSAAAAARKDPAAASEGASAAVDGGTLHTDAVVAGADGRPAVRKGIPLQKSDGSVAAPLEIVPPAPDSKPAPGHKLSSALVLGGAALLGGLQGWFGAGWLGAAAGAGLGLAAAWLFQRKDYGGAFGVTAGAIIGTALAGPVGGLIGAAVGGFLGHFLGKLFL